jgi:DNA polymerase-3 subunit epsilon
MGIVKVVNYDIVSREYFLVKPPENFYEKKNTEIHNLTAADTENSDLFPIVWEKIKHFFDGSYYIVAHNASFDMMVLKTTLDFYELELPDFDYFNSIGLTGANLKCPTEVGRSLEARCKYFNIVLDNHHNALCDAEACANLVICAAKKDDRYFTMRSFLRERPNFMAFSGAKIKPRVFFGGSKFNKVSIKKVAAQIDKPVSNDNFKNKSFVFTGDLKRLTREQAYAKVMTGGGHVLSSVSKKTDVLVSARGETTNKMEKALALQAQGCLIKIVDDEQFMKMIESCDAIKLD